MLIGGEGILGIHVGAPSPRFGSVLYTYRRVAGTEVISTSNPREIRPRRKQRGIDCLRAFILPYEVVVGMDTHAPSQEHGRLWILPHGRLVACGVPFTTSIRINTSNFIPTSYFNIHYSDIYSTVLNILLHSRWLSLATCLRTPF